MTCPDVSEIVCAITCSDEGWASIEVIECLTECWACAGIGIAELLSPVVGDEVGTGDVMTT